MQIQNAREAVFDTLQTLTNFFGLQGLVKQSSKPNEFPYELIRTAWRGANANIVVIAGTVEEYTKLQDVALCYLHKFKVSLML